MTAHILDEDSSRIMFFLHAFEQTGQMLPLDIDIPDSGSQMESNPCGLLS